MVSNGIKLVLDILLDSGRNCVPDHGHQGTIQLELPILILSDTMSGKFG